MAQSAQVSSHTTICSDLIRERCLKQRMPPNLGRRDTGERLLPSLEDPPSQGKRPPWVPKFIPQASANTEWGLDGLLTSPCTEGLSSGRHSGQLGKAEMHWQCGLCLYTPTLHLVQPR